MTNLTHLMDTFADIAAAGYKNINLYYALDDSQLVVHTADRQYFLELSDHGTSTIIISRCQPQFTHEKTIKFASTDEALANFRARFINEVAA